MAARALTRALACGAPVRALPAAGSPPLPAAAAASLAARCATRASVWPGAHQLAQRPAALGGFPRAAGAARPRLWLPGHRAKSSARPELQADREAEEESVVIAAVSPATPAWSVDVRASSLAPAPPASPPVGSDTAIEVEGLEGVGLSQRMRERLATCGITSLFPVQRATFEALMNGKDMLVKARTGSGKTIGFALPIIEKIMAAREEQRPRKGRAPASVVLAPTRELALQIQREFTRIEREVTAVCIYGGAPSFPQERELRGGVDVVVGTPGRVIDMIERGALRMNEVKVFVLDEADEMLKMGFQDDVDRIMEELPEERQMNLWSATQPRWITQMARKYCKNLETMDMVGNNPVRTADTIRHVAVAAYWEARGSTVANMVRAHAHGKRALVFCNTKMDVESVAAMPELVGMARVIHGDVNQQQRERTLADFRAGRFTVLVATDVAARGIDVPEVALVVQTKVPEDEDTFVHRSGRTGRAGRAGLNVVLYNPGEEGKLLSLANQIGITFALEGAPSTHELLESRKDELSHILDAVPPQSTDAFSEMAREMYEQRGLPALAAALASLAGFRDGGPQRCSLLGGRPNHTTVKIDLTPKIAKNLRGIPDLRRLLQTAYPQANFAALGKVVRLRNGDTWLMDMESAEFSNLTPSGHANSDKGDVILSDAQPGVTLSAARELPSLNELVAAMRASGGERQGQRGGGGRGYRGGAGGGFRGGGGGAGAGGGYRGGGNSSGGGRGFQKDSRWGDYRGGDARPAETYGGGSGGERRRQGGYSGRSEHGGSRGDGASRSSWRR